MTYFSLFRHFRTLTRNVNIVLGRIFGMTNGLGAILVVNETGINMMCENNIRRNFYNWEIRSRRKVLLSEDCGF